jgi:hypothetical protein
VRAVEVVREPALAAASRRRPVDRGHDGAAGVAPDVEGAEGQRDPDAAERGGHLVVEELLEPDGAEHPREPHQEVLRHDPPQAHRHGGIWQVRQAGVPGHAEPPGLHGRRDGHGEAGRGDAGADALQGRDTRVVPRQAPGERHDGAVVDRDHDYEGGADERDERGGRHDVAGGDDAPVHRAPCLVNRVVTCEMTSAKTALVSQIGSSLTPVSPTPSSTSRARSLRGRGHLSVTFVQGKARLVWGRAQLCSPFCANGVLATEHARRPCPCGVRERPAVGGFLGTVRSRAEQEDGEAEHHGGPARAVPDGPADVVLDVADAGRRDGVAPRGEEVEPVEVGAPGRVAPEPAGTARRRRRPAEQEAAAAPVRLRCLQRG